MGAPNRVLLAATLLVSLTLVYFVYRFSSNSLGIEYESTQHAGHYHVAKLFQDETVPSEASIVEETMCDREPLKFTKRFLYLVQTEVCAPKYLLSLDVLGDSSACQCDVIVLSFKKKCTDTPPKHFKYIHSTGTSWTTGRELQYNASLQSGNKYLYYIFLDDDSVLEVYRGDKKRNPWRLFEDFLFRLRPPIAPMDTETWRYVNMIAEMRQKNGCKHKQLEENVPAMYWDAMFNAFHYEAVKNVLEPILPYWTKFDSESWWYSNWYVCVMSDVVYHHQNVYNSEVIARNAIHRSYPRHSWTKKTVTQIFADIEKAIPEKFRVNRGVMSQLNEWRTTDLDLRRKNHYNYCIDLPKPVCDCSDSPKSGCVQAYHYATSV